MQLNIVNTSNNPLPAYETKNSAGMDLRAFLPEGPITLEPMQRGLVPTGIYMEIPEGYEGQVRPRSGLALKSGITVLNSPGTIDADYRGQICVILINLSDKSFILSLSTAATASRKWSSPNANKLSLCKWKFYRKQNAARVVLDTRGRVESVVFRV